MILVASTNRLKAERDEGRIWSVVAVYYTGPVVAEARSKS